MVLRTWRTRLHPTCFVPDFSKEKMTRVRYEDKAQNAIKTQFRANYKNEKCSTELSLSINYVKNKTKMKKKRKKIKNLSFKLLCWSFIESKTHEKRRRMNFANSNFCNRCLYGCRCFLNKNHFFRLLHDVLLTSVVFESSKMSGTK